MTHTEFQKVRTYLAALEALVAKAQAGWASDESLLEFRRLCWASLLIARDPECQQQIDLLVQYSKDLFSGRERLRLMRERIRAVLNALGARLTALEGGYGKRWRDLRAA